MKIFTSIILLLLININAQDRWEKLNGPVGGLVSIRAFGDTLLAGTNNGTIFYSLNNGAIWKQSNFKISEAVLDFEKTADDAIIATAKSKGVFKTYDLDNWQSIYNNGNIFYKLGKDYENNIYAGNDNGQIIRSTNSGTTWSLSLLSTGTINNFILFYDSTLFTGGWTGIHKKEPGSNIWEYINLDTVPSSLYNIFSDTSNNLYAFSYGTYLLVSSNSGDNWKYLDTLGFLRFGNLMYACIYNNKLIGGLAETGLNSAWGVVLSDDNGHTWRQSSNIGLPPKFSSARSLAKSGNNTYLGTNAAGVFKSTDFGESWFPINNGLTAALTRKLIIGNDGIFYAVSWSNGIQKSLDNGETWIVSNNGLTNSYLLDIIEDDKGILIAGSQQGIFRSTDKGESWEKTTSAGNDYSYNLFKDNSNRVYSLNYGNGIHRTTDQGNSWTRIDNNFVSSYVFGFAIDEKNNIYAGTRRGAIYKSTNDGVSWTRIYQSSNTSSVISHIAVSPNGSLFAANIYEGILRSTDNGVTWDLIKTDGGYQGMYPIAINSKEEIYTTGSGDKLFFSSNNGKSWEDITSNMVLTTTRDIIFDKEGNVYLATDESVWRSNPDSVTSIADNEQTVYEFSLSQNYPNPFNPVTKIKYVIPTSPPAPLLNKERGKAEMVTLKIYDILGNQIATLVNEAKEPGEYEVEWNAGQLPSGVYFYKLQAGDFTNTKKLLLLK